jgi:hypothetical protein
MWLMAQRRLPIAHSKNAAGPFYVEDGCCTKCGVPDAIAPDLFEYDRTPQCYVRRQPESADELERMLTVVWSQELGCIRYRGSDERILQRLADAGAMEACDFPAKGIEPVFRNIVRFAVHDDRPVSLRDFAADLQRRQPHARIRTRGWRRSSLSIAWYEDHFHKLTLERADGSRTRRVIRQEGPLGLSIWLHQWLSETLRAEDVRWFSAAEVSRGSDGEDRPW